MTPPRAPADTSRAPVVHIDRLALRLPAGMGARAPIIARLTATELADRLRDRTPPPRWRPGPVHVDASPRSPDAVIASRVADRLTKEWR